LSKTAIASPSRLPCGGTPYEDVARVIADVIHCYEFADSNGATPADIINGLADLFAADNPLVCRQCGDDEGSTARCLPDEPTVEHSYDGFDREQFLAACGLKKEG